jgi:sialic acid synthase SpsE
MSVFIVGEIGINHNGKLENALSLINVAYWAGFDAVKFQKRNPELYPERPYESKIIGTCTYREHKRALELSDTDYRLIDDYCAGEGVPVDCGPEVRCELCNTEILEGVIPGIYDGWRFLGKRGVFCGDCMKHVTGNAVDWFASCFDKESVDFIAQFNPSYWKIASPCMLDLDLVRYIARQDGHIIMSTGMSTEEEVLRAVSVVLSRHIAHNYDGYKFEDIPTEAIRPALWQITLLHCCSEYPTPIDHVNLNYIEKLRGIIDGLGISVGYSSHDGGVPLSVAAVALGAEVIEVHITLDRAMPGSDHAASLEREEMERLVRHIRAVEIALGSNEKQFYEGERKIRVKVQKTK